jgi:hypothetical protein
MRKSDFRKTEEADLELKKRVDAREWDFSQVPSKEEQACCYYEYARESSWLMDRVDNPPEIKPSEFDSITKKFVDPTPKAESLLRKKLENSLLIYALPGIRNFVKGQPLETQRSFDGRPWLAHEHKWREEFCQNVIKYKDKLSFGRLLDKTPDRAFGVGIALPFPWVRWEKEHEKRIFDQDTGLEVLLVTVDWDNFTNDEIFEQFRKWCKSDEGRPKGVGLKTRQGKRMDAWRKKLDRLALMRLRHHYSLEELPSVLPEAWRDAVKFNDSPEIERERKAALRTLFELFSFLPQDTKPINWSKV